MRKFPEAVYVSDNEGTHRLIAVNLQQRKIKPTVWEQWARLISTELKLVVALKKSLQGKYNLEPKPE